MPMSQPLTPTPPDELDELALEALVLAMLARHPAREVDAIGEVARSITDPAVHERIRKLVRRARAASAQ